MKLLNLLSLLTAAAIWPASASAQDATAGAGAALVDGAGKHIGSATFKATPSGKVQMILELTGIPAGSHGIHIHEKGICDPVGDFASAGAHYSGGMKHGVMTDGGPHAGDLPNVNAGPDGVVKAEFFIDGVSLDAAGKNPLRDSDGSAVVIHAEPDDYISQPAGESGKRIACGVIQ